MLPSDCDVIALHSRSIPESLQGQARPPEEALIVVVSRWPEFLRWSRAILVAAGIDPEAIDCRDAHTPGWSRGLRGAAMVVTDSVMVGKLPENCRARVFKVLSDASIAELQGLAGHFGERQRD